MASETGVWYFRGIILSIEKLSDEFSLVVLAAVPIVLFVLDIISPYRFSAIPGNFFRMNW